MTFAALRTKAPESWHYFDTLKQEVAQSAPAFLAPLFPLPDEAPHLVLRHGVLEKSPALPHATFSCTSDHLTLTFDENFSSGEQTLFLDIITAPDEAPLATTLTLAKKAHLRLVTRHAGSGFAQQTESIHLAEGAHLVHLRHITSTGTSLLQSISMLAENARLDTAALFQHKNVARLETHVHLAAPTASANLYGFLSLADTAYGEIVNRVFHDAPYGTSHQKIRALVADKAHGVFQGKIIVAPGAIKTDSRQESRALLLSDQAEMDAKPDLEIYADDVACSHGNTIGTLDDEALFYLRSRGIPDAQARVLLRAAFIADIAESFEDAPLRALLQSLTEGNSP